MTLELVALLERTRLLPVLTVASTDDARVLRDGFADASLPIAEVTLRHPAALDAVRVLADGDLVVGAGTVLSIDDAERALEAGARFLVSPGTTPALLEWCRANGVPIVPGVATPTEAMAVRDLGVTTAKLFPASVVGGADWLRAVAGPLPDLRFVATGGIVDAALPQYLAAPNLLAVGGSWFLPRPGDGFTGQAVADGVRAVRSRIDDLTEAQVVA